MSLITHIVRHTLKVRTKLLKVFSLVLKFSHRCSAEAAANTPAKQQDVERSQRRKGCRVSVTFCVFSLTCLYRDSLLLSSSHYSYWVSQNNGLQSDNSTSVCVLLVTIIHSSLSLRGIVIVLCRGGSIRSLISINGASYQGAGSVSSHSPPSPVASVFRPHKKMHHEIQSYFLFFW